MVGTHFRAIFFLVSLIIKPQQGFPDNSNEYALRISDKEDIKWKKRHNEKTIQLEKQVLLKVGDRT